MRRFAPFLFCALGIAGCTAGPDGNSHLSGSTWSFERIDGERPASEAANLTFSADRIGVQVGCNRLDGRWRMDQERLVAGPLTQTEMACPAPAWMQEKAVGSLLVATPRILIDGNRMILQSSGHTAELVRKDIAGSGREGR